MSHGNSPERARMMRALGAEVILVDQAPGAQKGQVSGADLAKVEERAQRLVAERNGFRADQFHHPANRGAHLTTTGPELWQQSGGQLDAFVDFVGSGGTYAGTIQALKAFNPACKGYVVEPDGAAVLSGQGATQPQHPIQGGGYAMKQLAALASGDIDGYLTVTGNDAKEATRGLARLEGVFAGFSAGANLAAAAKLLQRTHKGETIAIIICDSGLKYLSTDLWG
jgi:cysteine synthase A